MEATKKVAYIAGPMRGKPQMNWPAFFEAEKRIKAAGYEVINPARVEAELIGIDPKLLSEQPKFLTNPKTCIQRDLNLIIDKNVTHIFMLDGWEYSDGAKVEFMLGLFLDLKFMDAWTMEPLDFRFSFIDGFNFSSLDSDDSEPKESILDTAKSLVTGDRQAQYGPPDQDFARTAGMWSALKGVEFKPWEVAAFMICLKLSRQKHQRKPDNWVDAAGYAHCGQVCDEEELKREGKL